MLAPAVEDFRSDPPEYAVALWVAHVPAQVRPVLVSWSRDGESVGPAAATGRGGLGSRLPACSESAPVRAEQLVPVRYKVVGPPVGAPTTQPVAVPVRTKSVAVRPVTSVAKVSWKARVAAFVSVPL